MFMKNCSIIAGLLILMILSSCEENRKINNLQNQWSGLNPTSIPISVRVKETEKGNLVSNPSFELGKHYTVDSTNLSFNLPGWKKVGENVYWTNTENRDEYNEEDASSGIHAIKVTRRTSDETDLQGEGIITDYIRVIPGNYLLSFDVKLSHIRSNLRRLGTGIFDAVNIRVYCYDRNKVIIKNTAIHPLYNNEIDNSFKGFGFSNHDKIEDFGWSRVFGRAGNFPFEEGNLPEETRYIKIFAGLKGEGEMWVDRFDFRYSNRNFTLLEQLEPYFDTTLERGRYLIPTPRETEYYKKLTLVYTGENDKQLFPRLLLPANMPGEIKNLIISFTNNLPVNDPGNKNSFGIITRFESGDFEKESLIYSFGFNSLAGEFSDLLPFDEIQERKQSYFIKRLTQLPNVIFLGYHDLEGLKHALHSLSQLMDFKENIYHHYDIIDYPDYQSRGVIIQAVNEESNLKDFLPSVSILNELGLNTWVLESPNVQLGSNEIFNRYKNWISLDFGKYNYPFIRKGLSLENLSIPAYPDGEKTSEEAVDKYASTILESAKDFYEKLKRLEKSGFDLVIFSDRTLWESMNTSKTGSVILNRENFNRFMFYRNLFTKSFSQNNLDDLPDSYLIPFNLEITGKGNVYSEIYTSAIADSSINSYFSRILWPGPVKGASLIDPIDIYGFNNTGSVSIMDYSLTFRTESTYFGNYYSLYPGKALSGAIFKAFDTRITGIQPEEFNREMFLKVNDLSVVTRIRLATAADYLWNNSQYDPSFSLWKTLVNMFGMDVAKEIILFNDLYFKILSISLDFDLNGYNQKLEKQGEELIIQLNNHWDKIKISLENHIQILNELSDMKNGIISKFYQVQKNSIESNP